MDLAVPGPGHFQPQPADAPALVRTPELIAIVAAKEVLRIGIPVLGLEIGHTHCTIPINLDVVVREDGARLPDRLYFSQHAPDEQ